MLEGKELKEALTKGQYVSKEDYAAAEEAAKKDKISVLDYFFSKNLLTRDLLGQAIAEHYGVNYADLNSNAPAQEQVMKIPADTAKKFRVVLFEDKKNELVFTTDNPGKTGLGEELKKVFPLVKRAVVAYSLPEDIDTILLRYRKKLDTRFAKIIKQTEHTAPKLIDEVMADALQLNASDVHFEPQKEEVIIRFRIDDVLQEAGRIPKRHYETIINRVKVLGNLRTDEHSAAQDGAIRYELKDEIIDLRISIAPIVDGEKIAVRILSRYVRSFNLGNLGLSENHQQMIRDASSLPFGMILVTGPTGSGKTTSLYSVVKILNDPGVNITTIEDPVEYKIGGVNHIQVNEKTELTFAKGLRSIVRQDPDIILVGEIRDEETADIAVNAALTGHLLFSTFHANDAATSIPRLLDMSVEPFLLASTLELVIAQRLVRKICENCRASFVLGEEELAKLLKNHKKYLGQGQITLYEGKGCNVCNQTGYSGRTAIFELIKIVPELEDLMLKSPSAQEIWAVARKHGAASMFEDGLEKVKQGVTTIKEVLRVAQEPSDIANDKEAEKKKAKA